MKKDKFSIRWGLGGVDQVGNKVSIHYSGNMGSSMDSVNDMLDELFGMNRDEMVDQFEVIKESGSPSYSYCLTLKMPRGVRIAHYMTALSDHYII